MVLRRRHDLRRYTLASLRSQVSLVLQDTVLLSGTMPRTSATGSTARDPGADRAGGPFGERPRLHRGPAGRLRHRGRRAGGDAVRGAAPAHRHRARLHPAGADPGAGRTDDRPRRRLDAPGRRGAPHRSCGARPRSSSRTTQPSSGVPTGSWSSRTAASPRWDARRSCSGGRALRGPDAALVRARRRRPRPRRAGRHGSRRRATRRPDHPPPEGRRITAAGHRPAAPGTPTALQRSGRPACQRWPTARDGCRRSREPTAAGGGRPAVAGWSPPRWTSGRRGPAPDPGCRAAPGAAVDDVRVGSVLYRPDGGATLRYLVRLAPPGRGAGPARRGPGLRRRRRRPAVPRRSRPAHAGPRGRSAVLMRRCSAGSCPAPAASARSAAAPWTSSTTRGRGRACCATGSPRSRWSG